MAKPCSKALALVLVIIKGNVKFYLRSMRLHAIPKGPVLLSQSPQSLPPHQV